MEAKYVFDSNVFMNLQQRQPIDVYPSVWEKISELMEDGTITSSQEVYEEILVGEDYLSEWAKKRSECFLPTDEETQIVVRDILSKYRGLVEGGKKKNNADPFVIAVAKINGCTIVSEETRTNNPNSPKIPDVCSVLGLSCINFVAFSREMKISF